MMEPLRANRNRQSVVEPVAVPAPVEGWDASSALAAMSPLRAVQLKNWFPQPTHVEVRRGQASHATGMGGSTPVQSLMVWNGPSSSKMFAAASTSIYNVTASGAVGAADLSSLTNARWQHCNMTSAAGNFLLIVNGADSLRAYDGTTWTTPSITGVASSSWVHINVHKKRIWGVQINTTKAWYLGTDAISGAATEFNLGANFDLGGYLVAMATWTIDSGIGPDDYAVFISSKGQCAVYEGTDPASASTWGLVGVYNIPIPIGRRCFVKYGGNLLINTISGVLQLNLALRQDKAEISSSAITERINRAMNTAARSYGSLFGWEIAVYPRGTRVIVNIPTAENSTAKQYVMNSLTGGWCEFDNHNANCFAVFNDRLYYGTNVGSVIQADTGSADSGTAITAVGQTAYQAPLSAGRLKRFTMIQPLVETTGSARPSVGISVDFTETSQLSTPSGATIAAAVWGTAVWGTDVWGGGNTFVADWTSSSALGRFFSVKFQATTGNTNGTADQTMNINGFVVLAEVGGLV